MTEPSGGPSAGDEAVGDESTAGGRHQRLRVLAGLFILEQMDDTADSARPAGVLAMVFGPDGGAVMRRDDAAQDAWVALWNGDAAHDPQATGMLSAIVAPLAAGAVPVWVAASFDGDLVLVPAARLDEAISLLEAAGHHVAHSARHDT